MVNAVLDADFIKKIDAFKGKIPTWAKTTGNFGYADVAIEGVEKAAYFAHSAIQTIIESVKGTGIEGTLIKPIAVNSENIVNGTGAWL